MKVTTYETLYHEDHGATLKHKCGKRDSSIVPSLFFSHFIFFFSFFVFFLFFLWPFLFFFLAFLFFFLWHNALIIMIITLLLIYNSRITTQHLERHMTSRMPPAVYWDMQWIKSDMYEKLWGGFTTNTMSTTWSCKEQYDNDEMCHNKQNSGKLHGNISRNG